MLGERQQLEPPDTALQLTEDGKVSKVVTREGQGEPPPLHARCLVHYVGRLAVTGDTFLDTKAEGASGQPVEVVAGRDASLREVGLNLGVASMKCGEHCCLYVSSDYGYGSRGSFSFPSVPPDAALVYDVELIDYEPAVEGRERSALTFEERLEAAERRRLDGNELFRQGLHAEARGKYALALSYLDEELLMQLQGPHLEKAHAVKAPVHLNLAACALRTCSWQDAVQQSSEVLAIQPRHAKALFRRGKAQLQLGQTELAHADLELAQKLAPDDGAISQEISKLHRAQKAEAAAQAKMFWGAFKSPDRPATEGDRQAGRQTQLSMLSSCFAMLRKFIRTLFPWLV